MGSFEQLNFEGLPEPPVKPDHPYPKKAIYRGKPHRVLYYEGDNVFRLLDAFDCQVSVNAANFTFVGI
jgi:hypothetical protein